MPQTQAVVETHEYWRKALAQYKKRAGEFEEKYLSQDVLPRSHVWRPYRFATRDVIVGMAVIKHSTIDNLLDVDVCLMHTPEIFEDYEGTRIMLSFLLSEAFKSGGTMGIRFTEHVEGGRVPADICDYAILHGVELKPSNVFSGIVTPKEARNLFLAVTKLSKASITRIMELAVREKLSPERACYMVHHGVWTAEQAEVILLGAKWPDDVLLGTYLPENRHLYQQCLNDAKMAVLGGFIDRKLRLRSPDAASEIQTDVEGDDIKFEAGFNPEFLANEYVANEPIKIPWLANGKSPTLKTGEKLNVLLRPRDKTEISLSHTDDVKAAFGISKASNGSTMVLYPYDYHSLSDQLKTKLEKAAESAGILIGVCPETLAAITRDASAKMTESQILRTEV